MNHMSPEDRHTEALMDGAGYSSADATRLVLGGAVEPAWRKMARHAHPAGKRMPAREGSDSGRDELPPGESLVPPYVALVALTPEEKESAHVGYLAATAALQAAIAARKA